jgi:hypothetical protein
MKGVLTENNGEGSVGLKLVTCPATYRSIMENGLGCQIGVGDIDSDRHETKPGNRSANLVGSQAPKGIIGGTNTYRNDYT